MNNLHGTWMKKQTPKILKLYKIGKKHSLKLKLRLFSQQLKGVLTQLWPPTAIPVAAFNLDGLRLETKDSIGTSKQPKVQTIYF